MYKQNRKKVLIGFYGGVDSDGGTYLFKKSYKITGCFKRSWDSFENHDFLGNPNINQCCHQKVDFNDKFDYF